MLHGGCGVGGLTYALTKHFGAVVGVDSSEPHIRHGRVLQHHGQLEYERVREGILTDTSLVKLDSVAQRSKMSLLLSAIDALSPEVCALKILPLHVSDCIVAVLAGGCGRPI